MGANVVRALCGITKVGTQCVGALREVKLCGGSVRGG